MAEKSFIEFAEEQEGKPKKDRGFFESLYKVGSQGLTQTKSATGYADDVAAGEFDEHTAKDLAKDLIRQQNNYVPPQLEEIHHAFEDEAEDWDKAQGFFQSAGVAMDFVGEGIKQVATNPKGLAYFTAEQAGNMLPGMVATIGGAGVGAVTGAAVTAPTVFGLPVGAVVGGLIGAAGRFGSSWSIESGAKLQEVVGEELANRGLQITEANIKELLNDPIFAREAVDRARGKALGTAGVDAILGGITAGLGPKVAKATTKKMLKKGALGTLEFAGEGISEAAGQLLAEGKVDPNEIALEMMGGGIGAYTTALGASSKAIGRLNKKAKAELDAEAAAEKEAKVADGNEPESILEDGQVEEEIVAEAATEEAKEELNHAAAAIEEELQNRADDEHETHEAVKETVADTGVDKVELNNFIGRISDSVKTAAEFTRQLVAKFGEGIKKHALKLWNMVKSQRGSFSFNRTLDSEIKSKGTEWASEQLAIREKRLKINLMKGAEETSFVVKAIRGEIAQLKQALGIVEEPAQDDIPTAEAQTEPAPTEGMPVEEPAAVEPAVTTDEALLPEAPPTEEDLNFLNETQVDARTEEDLAEFNPRDPKFQTVDKKGWKYFLDFMLEQGREPEIDEDEFGNLVKNKHVGQNKFMVQFGNMTQKKLYAAIEKASAGKFLSKTEYKAVNTVFELYKEDGIKNKKTPEELAAVAKITEETNIEYQAAEKQKAEERSKTETYINLQTGVIEKRKPTKYEEPVEGQESFLLLPNMKKKSRNEIYKTVMRKMNKRKNEKPIQFRKRINKIVDKILKHQKEQFASQSKQDPKPEHIYSAAELQALSMDELLDLAKNTTPIAVRNNNIPRVDKGIPAESVDSANVDLNAVREKIRANIKKNIKNKTVSFITRSEKLLLKALDDHFNRISKKITSTGATLAVSDKHESIAELAAKDKWLIDKDITEDERISLYAEIYKTLLQTDMNEEVEDHYLDYDNANDIAVQDNLDEGDAHDVKGRKKMGAAGREGAISDDTQAAVVETEEVRLAKMAAMQFETFIRKFKDIAHSKVLEPKYRKEEKEALAEIKKEMKSNKTLTDHAYGEHSLSSIIIVNLKRISEKHGLFIPDVIKQTKHVMDITSFGKLTTIPDFLSELDTYYQNYADEDSSLTAEELKARKEKVQKNREREQDFVMAKYTVDVKDGSSSLINQASAARLEEAWKAEVNAKFALSEEQKIKKEIEEDKKKFTDYLLSIEGTEKHAEYLAKIAVRKEEQRLLNEKLSKMSKEERASFKKLQLDRENTKLEEAERIKAQEMHQAKLDKQEALSKEKKKVVGRKRKTLPEAEHTRRNKIITEYKKISDRLNAARTAFIPIIQTVEEVATTGRIKAAKKIKKGHIATLVAKSLPKDHPFNKLSYEEQENAVHMVLRMSNAVRNGYKFVRKNKRENYNAENLEDMRSLTQIGEEIDIIMVDILNESPDSYKMINFGGAYLRNLYATFGDDVTRYLDLLKNEERNIVEENLGIKILSTFMKNGQKLYNIAYLNPPPKDIKGMMFQWIREENVSVERLTDLKNSRAARAISDAINFSDNTTINVLFEQKDIKVDKDGVEHVEYYWGNKQEIPFLSYRRLIAQGARVKPAIKLEHKSLEQQIIRPHGNQQYELHAGWNDKDDHIFRMTAQKLMLESLSKSKMMNDHIAKLEEQSEQSGDPILLEEVEKGFLKYKNAYRNAIEYFVSLHQVDAIFESDESIEFLYRLVKKQGKNELPLKEAFKAISDKKNSEEEILDEIGWNEANDVIGQIIDGYIATGSDIKELFYGLIQEHRADIHETMNGLMEKHIEQSPLGNPKLFDEMVDKLSSEGISLHRDDLVKAWVDSGGNAATFANLINKAIQDKEHHRAEKVYRAFDPKSRHNESLRPSSDEIFDHVTSSLTADGKKLFKKFLLRNDSVELGLADKQIFTLLQSTYERFMLATTTATNKDFEAKHKDLMKRLKQDVVRITTDLSASLMVKVEDSNLFHDKAELTDFEQNAIEDGNKQGHEDIRIVTLRSPLSQQFYKLIAKIFGAELVIVSAENYKSRYIPGSQTSGKKSQMVVNINDTTPFSKIYAHELFHHLVNKADPAAYNTFKKALLEVAEYSPQARANSEHMRKSRYEKEQLINKLKQGDDIMQEEYLAELFAWAVTQPSFYKHLAKTIQGKTLATKMIKRLLEIVDAVNAIQPTQEYFSYAGQKLVGEKQLTEVYDLIHDLVGNSYHSTTQRRSGRQHQRFHTLDATKSELEGYLKYPERWLKGAWNAVFPKGTKNYKDVMTNLEKVIVNALKLINKMKPVGMMSDWLADMESVRLAHIVSNMAEKTVAKANIKTKKYKKVIKSFVLARQEAVKAELANKEWYLEVTKDKDGNDVKRYKHIRKAPATGATVITIDPSIASHQQYSNDIMFFHSKKQIMEKMHDEFVRGLIDVTKDEGKAKAKELGYTDEVIEAFIAFKTISDKLFERLQEVFPDLEMLPSHYGQSLQWFNNRGEMQDAAMDAILNPELNEKVSKMAGNESLRMGKNLKMSTAEIAEEYNLTYKTIDPHEMLMDYIRNAERLINMDRLIKEGKASGQVRVFSNAQQAALYGFDAVHDNATKIMRDLRTVTGFFLVNGDGEVFKKNDMDLVFNTEEEAKTFYGLMSTTDKDQYQIEETEQEGKSAIPYFAVYRNGKLVDYFNDEKDARAEAARLDVEFGKKGTAAKDYKDAINYTAKGVTVQAKTSEVARYYFHPDLAKMLNNLFAKDRIRDNRFGNTVMNIKNNMTSIEFMLSGFHFLTIGHELITSYMSWSLLKNRQLKDNKVGFFTRMKGMNPASIWAESREITAIFEYALESEGTERDTEVKAAAQKRLGELLKTDDLDVVDLVDMFFHSGGLMKQDKSLRGDIHDHAEMKYAEEDEISVGEDGDLIYKSGKASKKVFMNSIKEAMEEEQARHPNSPLLRKFNMTRFVSMEGGSAWLMEGFIPKVKMAMWAREYTMNLKKYEAEIAAGTMTHEEVSRHTMKFIEDRFGEVNWRNMWMNPTIKTTLQFLFRSFTWMVGSWKALGKAGIDLGKTGWFKLKGEEYELTEKGWWGINAVLVHMLTVAAINVAFTAITSLTGEGEDDDESEDITLLSRMLFPRMDALDPSGRYTVPSYITELYKIMQHTGVIGVHMEPWKLVSGRTNSLLSNSIEAISGQDWRGVNVRNEDDGIIMDSVNTLAHIFSIMPISISTIVADTQTHGFRPQFAAYGLMGMTSAPAAAKRSNAVTLAYVLRRNEHRGASVDSDVMELRDDVKKAAYKFAHGNRKPLIQMRMKQDITKQQFENAIKRLPKIDGKKNPKYIDPLSAALKNLSIEGSIKVWKEMTDREKNVQRYTLVKKFQNIRKLNTRSIKKQKEIYEDMQEAGILGAM